MIKQAGVILRRRWRKEGGLAFHVRQQDDIAINDGHNPFDDLGGDASNTDQKKPDWKNGKKTTDGTRHGEGWVEGIRRGDCVYDENPVLKVQTVIPAKAGIQKVLNLNDMDSG